jgi:hypothetical protein
MLPMIAALVSSLIANKLPGVANAVIDKGVDYVSDKLGIELKPDMTPEEMQKVAEAAMKHEEFLITEANDNTADARAMQAVALKQDDVFSKRFTYYLAAAWSFAAMLYIGFVTFATIPPANTRFADTILGFLLGTVIATILNFFFGSSASSVKKTEDMSEALKGAINDPSDK